MGIVKKLEIINRRENLKSKIENHIRSISVSGHTLKILEAGCGRKWDPNLDGINYFLTGVDLDKAALEIRMNTQNDLHEIIEGDLRSVQLTNNSYDVIYNSFVLEHIKGADQVLMNFVRWVKPNGIIILHIPDPFSVYGFIARHTPHWFHVFFYRIICGIETAGKPGYAPYPVYYDSVVSRKGIYNFCSRNNLMVLAEYGDGYSRPGKGIVKLLIHLAKKLFSILSFGHLSSRHTNLSYVLQKQSGSVATL
jgi:SAM-dependent methyltransferase